MSTTIVTVASGVVASDNSGVGPLALWAFTVGIFAVVVTLCAVWAVRGEYDALEAVLIPMGVLFMAALVTVGALFGVGFLPAMVEPLR